MNSMDSPPWLNAAKFEDWLATHAPGFLGPYTITKFAGGQSNPTLKVEAASGKYVMRRKPSGVLLPGAHAIEREYRVITALSGAGFPVPRTFGLCEDLSVAETPFYMMEMVEGRIFWDPTLPEVPGAARRAYYDAMSETIARLHQIDHVAIGLGDYGKTGNYIARQISRWSRAYRDDEQAGRIAAMDRLVEWLPLHIPDDGDPTTLVHGDYRCDNMIFHPTEPRVIAVLDWELSTLGNPLIDFTNHLMAYRTPRGLPAGMAGVDFSALGLPREQDYVAAYCKRTGRAGIPSLDYYVVFNMFRLAAIIHGIKGRLLRGNASNANAKELVAKLDDFAAAAWAGAQRAI